MATHTATMQTSDIQSNVRKFICNNFVLPDGMTELGDDDSFLSSEIIDSTGVLELVMFIEDTFGIEVDDAEIIPDNLDSVNKVSDFVGRKAGSAA